MKFVIEKFVRDHLARNNKHTSAAVHPELNALIKEVLDIAIEESKKDTHKTVMDRHVRAAIAKFRRRCL